MHPKRHLVQLHILKVTGESVARTKDQVAVEEPLEIRLSGENDGQRFDQNVSVTMRTPGDDFELAAGFLFTEGILRTRDELHEITYCVGANKGAQQYNVVRVRLKPGVSFDPQRLQRNFYATSSCGICGKASLESIRTLGCIELPPDMPRVKKNLIPLLPAVLLKQQSLFEKTGGIHAAALFDAHGNLLSVREDVGRHNAVDKLMGEQFLADAVPLHARLMLVSGRTSFEVLQKALAAGIPFVAGVGAPSSLAVDLAREFNLTLCGFVRDGRFNVYSGEARLV